MAVPFACIGVFKARVLANEGLQTCWGRGVPMTKHVRLHVIVQNIY
jgi:hypothetical protein